MNELLRRMHQILRDYRTQTGLELNTDWLELHIHPDDWADALLSPDAYNQYRTLAPNDLHGVPVIQDAEVSIGKPELRSTWKAVI